MDFSSLFFDTMEKCTQSSVFGFQSQWHRDTSLRYGKSKPIQLMGKEKPKCATKCEMSQLPQKTLVLAPVISGENPGKASMSKWQQTSCYDKRKKIIAVIRFNLNSSD